MSAAVLELTSLAESPAIPALDTTHDVTLSGTELVFVQPVSQRGLRVDHGLTMIGLKALTEEEELMAYQASLGQLDVGMFERLDAIELELDRRWALYC